MAKPEFKKLNNMPEISAYIEFPLAFTGKTKNGSASAFAGLLLSCQFVLAVIHTMNKLYREPAKLIYEYFVQNFGMSKETIRRALKTLTDRGIIKSVKQSRYVIEVNYNKKDYVEIDTFWLKREWEVQGKKKRLTYSRLLALALLKRGCENPKTEGVFVSSQGRIGKALNLPRTTAGDTVRELIAASLAASEKTDGNDKRKRGCSVFTVNPDILAVTHPRLNVKEVQAFFNLSKQEPTADELHARLMLDFEYKNLIEHIKETAAASVNELLKGKGNETPELVKLETEMVTLGSELEEYFKIHKVKREIFPPGYFKTDSYKKIKA